MPVEFIQVSDARKLIRENIKIPDELMPEFNKEFELL